METKTQLSWNIYETTDKIWWHNHLRHAAMESYDNNGKGWYPDSKVHGANMGPTWVLSAPDGPHVGPMNLAIRVLLIDDDNKMSYKYILSIT